MSLKAQSLARIFADHSVNGQTFCGLKSHHRRQRRPSEVAVGFQFRTVFVKLFLQFLNLRLVVAEAQVPHRAE